MIKKSLIFVLLGFAILVISYFLHEYVLESMGLKTNFSLLGVYALNLGLSICTYVILSFVNNTMPTQTGYTFLVFVAVKPGVLLLVFGKAIFGAESFKLYERLGFMIPFLIFLLLEVISIHGILKSEDEQQKDSVQKS